jgi:hypothetical protein
MHLGKAIQVFDVERRVVLDPGGADGQMTIEPPSVAIVGTGSTSPAFGAAQ